MRQAAIYARVSSDKQEEQKTIDSQVAELRGACRRAGDSVVREYLDDGVSGASLVRPQLDRLRDDAGKGVFDCVYILSPDRLARRYVYQVIVIEELRKQGIDIVFLDKPVTDRPEDQLLLGMQGLIAEYERAQILERTRRGRLFRARKGEIMGGPAPYGYRLVRKTADAPAHYVVDDEQAAVVRLILDLYLKEGSINKVVLELDRRGIRPPGRGRYWARTVIHRMLKRETYIGTGHYNKESYEGRKRQVRPREEWIPIEAPAIVDQAVFQAARDLLARHKPNKKTRTYLLTGLMKCALCGSGYSGTSPRRGKDAYYRCGNDSGQFLRSRTCTARFVRADRIEPAVMSALQSSVADAGVLAQRVMELFQRARDKGQGSGKRGVTQKALAALEVREQRLLDVYLDGAISREEFGERRRALQAKKAELQEALRGAPPDQVSFDRSRIIEGLEHFCQLVRERMGELSPERRQAFLRYVVERVTYDARSRTASVVVVVPGDLQGGGQLRHVPGGGTPVTRSNALLIEITTHVS